MCGISTLALLYHHTNQQQAKQSKDDKTFGRKLSENYQKEHSNSFKYPGGFEVLIKSATIVLNNT